MKQVSKKANKIAKSTDRSVDQIIQGISRKALTSNTQRVALELLTSGDWIARNQLRTPNAPSRARELRTKDFGAFRVEVKRAGELNRRGSQTFYRIDPACVTPARVSRIFRGVINAA